MNSPEAVLPRHAVVVRDGRLLDVLPSEAAAGRYTPRVVVERPHHVLMPGLVNARAALVPKAARPLQDEQAYDAALLSAARLLRAGVTCLCAVGFHPRESARVAAEQGLRAVIGLPVAEHGSAWADGPADYLTRALAFRDEFRGHPTIGTMFAPVGAAHLSDAAFVRIATLANELDAGIVLALHETRLAVADSLRRHGMRPLARMHSLGLLTPSLCAVHMIHLDPADLALAQLGGIAAIALPTAGLIAAQGMADAAAWRRAGLRLGVGGADPWSEFKFLSLVPAAGTNGAADLPDDPETPRPLTPWEALAVGTSGGACALGLEAEVGTLEAGKWADLCCIELGGTSLPSEHEPLAQLAYGGGREQVSDVWIAGRHLLNEGRFTRLDWPALAARF